MFTETFSTDNFIELKQQLLTWANRFSSCSFLDNHQYRSDWQMQECLVAAGIHSEAVITPANAAVELDAFITGHKNQWIFGHLSFDFRNELNGRITPHPDKSGFAVARLFVPEILVKLAGGQVTISSFSAAPASIWNDIKQAEAAGSPPEKQTILQPAVSREDYISIINQLREHIHRGDCYEINFCQEFFSNDAAIDPVSFYNRLSHISPNPFSCFYKNDASYLVCASPERFIARKGNRVFSQPIKGTAPRQTDTRADALEVEMLFNSPKERSENVMVVDLVRNDLSIICREGTVKVDELFGIYTYPHLHQMISTISGELKEDISFMDIMRATFPMGSMTGAPKKKVLELIGEFEKGSRGLFSGAVGYISPAGDFDFNVVIRSVLYNQQSGYLSYWVGSGITWLSNAEQEYEECMLKALAIKKVLQNSTL